MLSYGTNKFIQQTDSIICMDFKCCLFCTINYYSSSYSQQASKYFHNFFLLNLYKCFKLLSIGTTNKTNIFQTSYIQSTAGEKAINN